MTLSTSDKVVLIKSNFIDIPQYPMDWFKIPKYVCKEIDNINRSFL